MPQAPEAPIAWDRPGEMLSWWRVLLSGLLLYVLGMAVMIVSSNPNLFPTVVMLGNFLVPVTYVVFFYNRRHLSRLSAPTTAMSFFSEARRLSR